MLTAQTKGGSGNLPQGPEEEPERGRKAPNAGPHPSHLRRGPRPRFGDQHLNVLHSAGEQLLDLHAPEPSPPGSVEAIAFPPGKRALHQVLAGADVSAAGRATSFRPLMIQFLLPAMASDFSPRFALGALRPQRARFTGPLAGRVTDGVKAPIVGMGPQLLTRRTDEHVALSIVAEAIFSEHAAHRVALLGGLAQVGHVSLDPTVVALEQVLHCAVLRIGHDGIGRFPRVGLVAIQQGLEYVGLVGVASSGLGYR